MSQQLLLRSTVPPQVGEGALSAESLLDWWLISPSGTLVHYGCHPLSAIAAAVGAPLGDCRITLLVPGELVLLTEVSIPSRQLRHIKQALPYLVEELIADNIEEVHLALPAMKIVGDQPLPVAVAAHRVLIQWLDQCYGHGIELNAIVPDTLAMPWRPHSDLFFVDGERVLYREDRYAGLAMHRSLVELQLAAMTDSIKGRLPRHCQVAGSRVDEAEVTAVAEAVRRHWGVDVETTLYEESPGEVLALNACRHPDDLINLRQGGYGLRREQRGAWQWRATAAVVAGGLVLYALLAAAGGLWLDARADRLYDESVALYRELFPQERRIVSPQRQMAAQLRADGVGAGSSLPLLARIADTLALGEVELDEVRVQNGTVQMQLRADSLEQLGQLQQQLRAAGFAAEINSAAGQGDQTVGRLQISENPS